MNRWAKRLGIAAAFALVLAACSGARDASIHSPEIADRARAHFVRGQSVTCKSRVATPR